MYLSCRRTAVNQTNGAATIRGIWTIYCHSTHSIRYHLLSVGLQPPNNETLRLCTSSRNAGRVSEGLFLFDLPGAAYTVEVRT